MNVALACPYAWDAPGGVQAHVRGLAQQLRRTGHRTIVLAPGWATGPDGVIVVARPVRLRFNGSVAPIGPDLRSVARIRQELRVFRPDVLHVHEPFSPSTGMFATMAAPRGADRPAVVATFHAYADRSIALSAFAPALRLVWDRLDVRVAVSAAAASFAGRRFHDGMRIVPNGIDVRRFADAEPAALPAGRRILFVGRLEPRKGFRHAVRAFGLLAADVPDALLVVAGEGPEGRAVDELPREIRSRVLMVGVPSHDDLPRLHAASEAFVAPNTGGESFGLVVAEALAAGVPVVASDIPGYREVVRDGVEGLLVPPRDPAALAAAVRRILEDPALAERLRRAGRARAAAFAWETVGAQIERAYRDALARTRSVTPR